MQITLHDKGTQTANIGDKVRGQTHRHTDRHTNRHTYRHTYRLQNIQTYKLIQTHKQTHIQTRDSSDTFVFVL